MSNERALWENEYCAINTSSAARPVEVVTPETARYLEVWYENGWSLRSDVVRSFISVKCYQLRSDNKELIQRCENVRKHCYSRVVLQILVGLSLELTIVERVALLGSMDSAAAVQSTA
eukprot:748958-Hanusia_phi.AAC.1